MGNSTGQEYVTCRTVAHKHFREVKRDSTYYELCCVGLCSGMPEGVYVLRIITVFFQLAANGKIFQKSLNLLFCPLPSVRVRSRGFPQMGCCYLLKYNGGDSGIKISVFYWRCSLIRVSVIRVSTVSVHVYEI
jgi:hypothetical protein